MNFDNHQFNSIESVQLLLHSFRERELRHRQSMQEFLESIAEGNLRSYGLLQESDCVLNDSRALLQLPKHHRASQLCGKGIPNLSELLSSFLELKINTYIGEGPQFA